MSQQKLLHERYQAAWLQYRVGWKRFRCKTEQENNEWKNCRGAEQGRFRSIQTVGQTERYMRVFRKKKKNWHTMGRQILQCRVPYVNNWKKRRKKLKGRVKQRDWWRSKSEKAVDGGNSLAFCTLLYMRTGLGCCPSRSYPGLERETSLRKKSTGFVFSSFIQIFSMAYEETHGVDAVMSPLTFFHIFSIFFF